MYGIFSVLKTNTLLTNSLNVTCTLQMHYNGDKDMTWPHCLPPPAQTLLLYICNAGITKICCLLPSWENLKLSLLAKIDAIKLLHRPACNPHSPVSLPWLHEGMCAPTSFFDMIPLHMGLSRTSTSSLRPGGLIITHGSPFHALVHPGVVMVPLKLTCIGGGEIFFEHNYNAPLMR